MRNKEIFLKCRYSIKFYVFCILFAFVMLYPGFSGSIDNLKESNFEMYFYLFLYLSLLGVLAYFIFDSTPTVIWIKLREHQIEIRHRTPTSRISSEFIVIIEKKEIFDIYLCSNGYTIRIITGEDDLKLDARYLLNPYNKRRSKYLKPKGVLALIKGENVTGRTLG